METRDHGLGAGVQRGPGRGQDVGGRETTLRHAAGGGHELDYACLKL